MPKISQRIGFLGAGQMATALAQGFVRAGLADGSQLVASDPQPAALARFVELTAGRPAADNRQVVAQADVVFLAVKPQQALAVLGDLRGQVGRDTLVVSIVAGIRQATLAQTLGGDARWVRVMPNTPCLVGAGACGYCLGERATAQDAALVAQLLGAVGTAHQLDEKLLDAVTGLSGSGPAFIYQVIEALSDGGVRVGLPRAIATQLAAQTVVGAAQMVLSTGEHPAVLKDRVASPGGTTIAGLQALEAGGLRAALMAAVEAATRRSIELAGPPGG